MKVNLILENIQKNLNKKILFSHLVSEITSVISAGVLFNVGSYV